VTKRVETEESEWADWNWRTDGDIMVNGAFFVPSGEGLSAQYTKASSVEPKSSGLVSQLTMNAGVFGGPRDNSGVITYPGSSGTSTNTGNGGNSNGAGSGGGGGGDYFGIIFGNGVPPSPATANLLLCLLIILCLCMTTNHGALL
ncbi:pectate lyase, partial [Sarracenia purpurea var. burkii]